MDLLYTIFIFPIEAVLQLVLSVGYSATGHYGASIIILSLFVNLALLPIYHIADKWQQAERAMQSLLQPKLQELREAFSGEERFMMVRTLYRQAGYHPIYAVRSSVGFLIQVPFFIAAYQLLSHYQPLQGVAAFIFEDLSKPDALLWGLNVMPFVMTLINLLSASVYAQKLRRSDIVQLWGIALLFLVLLYNSAVALLIYWTFNNVFSFLKNLAYSWLAPNSTVDGGLVAECRRKLAGLCELSTPVNVGLFAIAVAIQATLLLSSAMGGMLEKNVLITISANGISLGILAALCAVFSWKRAQRTSTLASRENLRHEISTVFVWLLLTALVTVNSAWLSALYPKMPRGIMVGGLLLILGLFLVAPSLLKNVRVIKAMPDGHWLYAISATLLAFALFIANPISFYAHSTDFSSELFYRIAGELLVYFVIAVISFVSLYVLLDSPVRKCLTFLCVFGALDAITYSAIGVKHIGLMTYFHLPFISLLDRTRLEVVVEMAILLAFMGVTTYLTARYRENITRVMSAMLVASLCVAAADAYQGSTKVVRIQRGGLGMPSNHQDIIGFSRERNVLIIMLDGFPGGTIQTILNKDPGTLEDYEGFVWYPNMLTTHAGTLGSIATLTGGHKYTVQQINQGHYGTIGNAIREAYRTYPDAFIPKGFQVSYVKPYFNNGCESIDKRVLCTDTSPYGPYYHDREEPDALLLQDTHSHLPAVLSMTSVFKAAPFFLKGWVYDHGSWRGAISPTLRARRMNSYKVPDWGFLYVLAHESNADRPVKTFKFIHLEIPHNPYVLGATCRLLPPQASIDQALHVNIETESVCALRQIGVLLSWMKKNGIYDVTKIVLVSDHGLWSDNPMFPPGFSKTVPSGNHNQAEPGWLQSLLLVKDFDAKGKLSRSDTFLSQPDVPSIVCAAVGGCSDVGPDPTTHDLGDRVLTFVNTTWDLSKDEGNSHFTIMEGYEVRDNIFDPKNWKRFK